MSNIKAKMFNKRAETGAKEIIDSLEIQPGDIVADLGSGGGYYTLKFADIVGASGKVYAVDTDETFLAYIRKNIDRKQLTNVELVTANEKNTNLHQNSCDLVFLRNVFHHIADPVTYFRQLSKSLKPGGRVAIIDWKLGATFFAHSTAKEQIYSAMYDAGYKSIKLFNFLEQQNFIIFEAAK